MNITQLSYFLAVYDHGSYTDAANAMFTSRQTLGRAVAELEKEVGQNLFSRKGRGIEPTPFGVEAAEITRTIIANTRRLKGLASSSDLDAPDKVYTLAIPYHPQRGALVDSFALESALALKYQAPVNFQYLPSETCLSVLKAGIVDAVLNLGRADDPAFMSEFVGRHHATLALSSDNPLARKKTLTLKDITSLPLAQPDSINFFWQRITALCKAMGFSPEWHYVKPDTDAHFDFLHQGGGIFVYGNAAILQSDPKIAAIPIDEEAKLNYPVFLTVLKENSSPLADSIMKTMMDFLDNE